MNKSKSERLLGQSQPSPSPMLADSPPPKKEALYPSTSSVGNAGRQPLLASARIVGDWVEIATMIRQLMGSARAKRKRTNAR